MNKIKGILITGLLLLSILVVIAPVSAGTIHVYPGDDIGAILNSSASGDTIYVHAGTYTLNSDPYLSNKSLNIIGDGAPSTIINFVGSGARMYFYMYPGPSTTINISGITFKGATSPNTPLNLLHFANNTDTYTMTVNISDCVFDNAYNLLIFYALSANSQTVILQNSELKNGSNRGIQVIGYSKTTVKNCLLSRAGEGGIESWNNSETNVQSCTIDRSLGAITYYNNSTGSVKDSILTNNQDGIYNYGAGTVTATYNNLWNNDTNYNGVTPGAGSISQNPQFVTGRLGAYYLSPTSPSVDKGSTYAVALGLSNKTTRTDEKWDTGTVDMGYHYPSNRGPTTSLPIDMILKLLKKNK